MIESDALKLALGALKGTQLRSVLVLIAMAIGVAAVVVLTALGEGARHYVVNEFKSLGTHLVVVLPGRSETRGGAPPLVSVTPRDLTLEDALALPRSRSVARVAPIVVGSAQVSWRQLDREALMVGTTHEFFSIRGLRAAQGRVLPAGDPRQSASVCIIGETIRRELFGASPALGQWLRIGDRRYRVIGVLASTGQSIGVDVDEIVVIPVVAAQALLDTPSLFRVLVEARSREEMEPAKTAVKRILRERHEGEEDVTVISQDAVLDTFDRILSALTYTVASIAGISLLVAGILVMNVMLVSVAQRRTEIGILKALGASGHDVIRLFLTEAAVLSVVGAAAGLLVGYIGSSVIRTLYPILPVYPPWWAVVAAVIVALGTSVTFSVLPARRAARLDPVQALAQK